MSNEQLAIKIESEEAQIFVVQDDASYSRNIPILLVYRGFLFSLSITVPTLILFWRGIGFSMFEITALQSIFALAVVILEVPSGYVADALGRRGVLLSGAVIYLVATVLYAQVSEFWENVIIEMMLALAISLASGADQALLYDSLAALKREQEFSKLFGQMRYYEMVLMAIFSSAGGIIANYFGLPMTFYCAALGLGISVLAALSLVEPPKKEIKSQNLAAHVRDLISVTKQCLVTDKEIRWQLLFSGLLFAVMQSSLWLYQPYWELVGIEMFYFGFCFALLNIVSGITAKFAFRIGNQLRFERLCLIFVLLLFASYLGLANAVTIWGASFALLHQVVRGIMGILFSERLNKKIGSEYRATLISLQSFVWRLLYAIALIPVGLVVDSRGLISALNMLAAVTLVLGLGMMSLYRSMRLRRYTSGD